MPLSRLFAPLAVLLSLSLGACAVTPKTVTLFVGPEITRDTVGEGSTITLVVTDQRLPQTPTANALPARIKPDPVQELDRQVTHILLRKGFNVLERPTGGPVLMVSIDKLDYTTPAKPSQGLEAAHVVLTFSARAGRTILTRTYRANYERQVVLTTFADLSGHLLNQALTHALESFAKDDQLLALLAGKPAESP